MSGPNVLVTVQRPLYQELTTEVSRAKLHRLAGKLVFNESGDPGASRKSSSASARRTP